MTLDSHLASRPLVIFDLDGTLALVEHRLHHIRGARREWSRFFAACTDDSPNSPVVALLRSLHREAGWEVRIWSGRSDEVRAETEAWLRRHVGIELPLIMRLRGDHQPDVTLKESWLLALSPADRARLRFIVDDRDAVVQMWRRHGVVCLQCAEGRF